MSSHPRSTSRFRYAGLLAIPAMLIAGCSAGGGSGEEAASDTTVLEGAAGDDTTGGAASPAAEEPAGTTTDTEGTEFFGGTTVHSIELTYDEAEYDAMIEAFADTGEKQWIEATVVIDGETYEQVGLRLKGNSSLGGLGGGPSRAMPGGMPGAAPGTGDDVSAGSEPAPNRPSGGFGPSGSASAEEPESLPWLLRLDEFVEGQDHQGYEDIVIRSNGSETSLNEAVALDLLEESGLASQQAVATSFSVNGGDAVLRLAIEHPDDDAWQDANFDSEGALYKAESTGDWSYRGDDPASYEEVFDQEGGTDVTDLTPLMEFLQFLNESDDATFAAELPQRLDVDSFATYLAMMDLLGNFDDIDGPGNNAYLWYDVTTEQFTIVPWDMNLALGSGFGGGAPGGQGLPGGGSLPEGAAPPASGGQGMPGGGSLPEGAAAPARPGGGAFGRDNVLVQRFHADAELEALFQAKLTALRASLFSSGVADEALAARVATLTEYATELVDESTITEEAAAIAAQFSDG